MSQNKGGRPSNYTQKIADEICEYIACGKSLVSYCQQDGKPGYSTVMAWLAKHKEFQENYTRARDDQADYLVEEILEIADDKIGDFHLDPEKGLVVDGDHIQRARLRVEARKWIASKMKPKKYGDRIQQDIGNQDDKAFKVESTVTMTPADAYRKMLEGE